jgi:hypothetical protein
MLNLDDVTIVSINTINPKSSIKALEISCENINFKNVLLLSNDNIKHDFIQNIKISNIIDINFYNLFCVKYLHEHIKTDYCLIVQPDGFVTNASNWDNEFLNYDYIGAPWSKINSAHGLYRCGFPVNSMETVPFIVGNGGFSLRSKKILTEVSKLDYRDLSIPEDNVFSILFRKELKEKNIKYAPVNLALKFSLEDILSIENYKFDLSSHFGFHGKFNYFEDFLKRTKV